MAREPAGWTSTFKAVAKLTGLGVVACLSPDPVTATTATAAAAVASRALDPAIDKAVEIVSEGVGELTGAVSGEKIAGRGFGAKLARALDQAEAAFRKRLETPGAGQEIALLVRELGRRPLYDLDSFLVLLSQLGEAVDVPALRLPSGVA